MASGLFDSPLSQTQALPADAETRYRAIATTAILAGVFGLLSPLAFVDWWLAVVPAVGVVLGIVAWRDIAARPGEYVGMPLALGSLAVSACALVGGLAYQASAYAAELPPGFERLSYADLQPLEGDPPGSIPDTARAHDGHDVLLKGYMYPGKQQQGIVQFLLVRDQGDCCFGGNPKITDRVLVQLRDPAGIGFSPRICKIAGRFAVRPMVAPGLDGGVLYHLEDAVAR
ncbi:MAG: hypothetical protein EBZ74_09505 [Planctomycetia bacterium]|nr:hypothetical protein [Planctomycetia bacterium]